MYKFVEEELEKLKTNYQLREIPKITDKIDGKVFIDGKEYINFASNDYLGISTKKELIDEFLSENRSLLSSASARLLSGNSFEYSELENNLAKLFNKESALIFNTGYQMNIGIISALIKRGDVIFSDKLNHASIIDGMKLSGGDFYRYKHLNYENLESLLIKHRSKYKNALIVSESIFSMDGDIVNIDKLVELKNKYDCILMLDEAHAFCTCENSYAGLGYGKDVDIVVATLGKALGSFGAFCATSDGIRTYLINKARSFIFSTSIPPINIAWSNWLLTQKLDFIKSQKGKLRQLVGDAYNILNEYGYNLSYNTQIIPVMLGSNQNAIRISEKLKANGYYIPAIRPPTVPEGSSRLRISLTADINANDFKTAIEIINSMD